VLKVLNPALNTSYLVNKNDQGNRLTRTSVSHSAEQDYHLNKIMKNTCFQVHVFSSRCIKSLKLVKLDFFRVKFIGAVLFLVKSSNDLQATEVRFS